MDFDLVDWTPFSVSCSTPKESSRQELNIVYSVVDKFDFNNLDGTFIIKLLTLFIFDFNCNRLEVLFQFYL